MKEKILKTAGALILLALPAFLAKADYQLMWEDQFNSFNNTAWEFETGGGGWGNGESQYYTNRTDNVFIDNGNLVIYAKPESYEGKSYTSGRIRSWNHVMMCYGKIEARIKTPWGAAGVWPAFWMMGMAIGDCGWPTCGEIDIMEEMGTWDTNSWNTNLFTLHWNPNDGCNNKEYATYSLNYNFGYQMGTGYRIYGVEWTPTMITGYWADDNGNRTDYYWCDISGIPAFHRQFYMIMNIALGGSYTNYTIDSNWTGGGMYVDWVRVWQDYTAYPGSSFTNNSTITTGGGSSGDGSATTCATTDRAVATFCSDADFGGNAIGLPEGTYTTAQMAEYCLDNDAISSVKVLPGYKVTVYTDNDFGGSSVTYTSSISNVGDAFNDAISSIKIEAQGVSGFSGVYKIQGYNGKFMDLDGNSTADNTHVVQWSDEGTEYYQQWRFSEIGNGVYNIHPASNSGEAMDLYWGKVDNRTELLIYQYTNTSNQQFILVDAGNGYYQLVARYCGKVLEDPDFSATDGEYMKLYDNNNQTCSWWKIYKQTPDGYPVVTLYDDINYGGTSVGLYLGDYTEEKLSAYNFPSAILTSAKVAKGYKLTLYDEAGCSGNSVSLTENTTYVGADWNDKMKSARIEAYGTTGKSGLYKLKGRNSGLYMDMDGNKGDNSTQVVQWTDEGADETCQKFRFTEIGNGVYYVANAGSLERLVEIAGASNDNWANVTIYDNNGGDHQKFILSDTGDGYYQLIALQNGKVIEDPYNSQSEGTKLGMYDNNNQYCSHWALETTYYTVVNNGSESRTGVYPNPADNRLYVNGAKGYACLYDLLGRPVRNAYLGEGVSEFPVAGLQPGTYVLKAGGQTYRIVKR